MLIRGELKLSHGEIRAIMIELGIQMAEKPEIVKANSNAMNLSNLMIIAPHKAKYYRRYDIQWLIDQVAKGDLHIPHQLLMRISSCMEGLQRM